MNSIEIVRSWKDDDYWLGLNAGASEYLPVNPAGGPAGEIELSDDQLANAGGGTDGSIFISIIQTIIISIRYCADGRHC